MRIKVLSFALLGVVSFGLGCKSKTADKPVADNKPKLGIRPHGDETIQVDTAKVPADLAKVFDYIDSHIDEHVENLQKWIQQPSISNSGEGIPESAEMVKGFFDKLGCQQTRVYDVGITEYGTPGNPVVYAHCDEGAAKTLVIYWQYDTMPVTQPENWVAPPFEGRIVDGKTAGVNPDFKKVLIGRGATNSKGPEMAGLNAIMSMKAVMGKLPVNLIFVAEGDEERMDIGLRKFMKEHSDLFKDGDAMLGGGGSEGCVYVELQTSGKSWGRGPTVSDIHGVFKRTTDSPAWRHIQMLASLTSKDGNTPLIKGWYDNIVKPTPEQLEALKKQGEKTDLAVMAKNVGVARFIADTPEKFLEMGRYGTSFNLDGIWGGNMYAGGAGAILPNKITSKHGFRYVPNMNGLDLVKKLRAQLDANGYKDVEMKLIGDVPWAKNPSRDTDISHAGDAASAMMGLQGRPDFPAAGGYWPAYVFTDQQVGEKVGNVMLPMGGARAGSGGRAHAANEYMVIEGAGKTYGYAGAEKTVAATIYSYAKMTTVAPRPKSH
ncbi:MAG: Acetylornithine deacetylase/Succinyl-diaminopimelate desuccinylase [Acidobacteriaceae bacterium]|nr:Acetylornithine deacetylase/Succinyl-diaminopimelate desuccinylase [Acidobacteriaceae bacterium]